MGERRSCLILPHALGKTSAKKNRFLSGIAQIPSPPSPQFRQVVQLFWDVKNKARITARITKPSNNDYDNDGSVNCDYNVSTFDNFGVKNDQKVSHNMILMSRYMGQLHGGRGPKRKTIKIKDDQNGR